MVANQTIAYCALVFAACCNGTFGVLHKYCKCSNVVFVVYYCLGLFIVSELTLPVLLALDSLDCGTKSKPLPCDQIHFSPEALISGFFQFAAINLIFVSIQISGIAVSMVGFAGSIILISVLENTVLLRLVPDREAVIPTNFLLFGVSLGLIMLGLFGVGWSRYASDLAKVVRDRTSVLLLDGVHRLSRGSARGSARDTDNQPSHDFENQVLVVGRACWMDTLHFALSIWHKHQARSTA